MLASKGWTWADPVFAIAVAIYIAYSAFRIGYESIQQLMDRELSPQLQQQIVAIACRDPEVHGVHDLRTRQSGQVSFIQLHLELDDHLPLFRAHAIADQVEADIGAAIAGAEVIVHQDPVSLAPRNKAESAIS